MRKRFPTWLAITAGLTLAASGATAQSTVNLTLWTWGDASITALCDRFNATHPGIKVTFNNVPSNGFYDKLFTAMKAGNAPDIANVEYGMLPTAISTGGLVDLSKYGLAGLKSKYEPWIWNQVSLAGGVYAVPQDIGPMGMFYRADLLKKYKIKVPATWAEFADAAAKLHAADPKSYLTNFGATDSGWLIGLAWQAGAKWFRVEGDSWVVNINDAATKKVAAYWQGLLDKKLVKLDPAWSDTWYGDLQSGGVASWMSASWGTGFLSGIAPKTAGGWRVAPMPQWTAGKASSANWGGSSTTVTKDSKHPKEAAIFAAWIGTNLKDSIVPRVSTGLFPAVKAGFNLDALLQPDAFYGNQRVVALFKGISKSVDPNFAFGPTMTQVNGDLNDAFSEAVNGKMTLVQALDIVQAKTVAFMRKQGLNVKE